MNKFREVKLQNCWERQATKGLRHLIFSLILPLSKVLPGCLFTWDTEADKRELLLSTITSVHLPAPVPSAPPYHRWLVETCASIQSQFPHFLSRSHSDSLQGRFSNHSPSASCVIKFSLSMDYTDQHRNILFFY